mmetsp:Transcript_58193/g.125811  ORF Transcript_58193/g.125811 Transcript_58193/m.125811 type:complete len:120 (+) Transcript_58193:55-414(+)|eukprot:CAMPEP_0170605562 /NCGR_PEP_ID=MMETSP0224-20130122/20038_1 /TAXON_ID=285029 /ORGANISM="Togula jolla, Strain CCCM 725" /LENGTH=119 /DNA_ID=CAMNT_0010930571 /DNA_START=52 /DNA_END=411 /DNA_ORIENTATION=-
MSFLGSIVLNFNGSQQRSGYISSSLVLIALVVSLGILCFLANFLPCRGSVEEEELNEEGYSLTGLRKDLRILACFPLAMFIGVQYALSSSTPAGEEVPEEDEEEQNRIEVVLRLILRSW